MSKPRHAVSYIVHCNRSEEVCIILLCMFSTRAMCFYLSIRVVHEDINCICLSRIIYRCYAIVTTTPMACVRARCIVTCRKQFVQYTCRATDLLIRMHPRLVEV